MSPHQTLTQNQRSAVESFRQKHETGVLTLLFTDVVGSTALKRELGDGPGTALIEGHQRVIREVLAGFDEAQEISTAGDSFFIVFLRPSDSVRFAMRLHFALRAMSEDAARPILVRVGIHMGEVFIDRQGNQPEMRDILGMQVDVAHTIMEMAAGGQTLMSRSIFDNARSIIRGEEMSELHPLSWLNHGPYRHSDVEEPFDVCEVGEETQAPLSPPPDSDSAKRIALPDTEQVLGWRPALEQTIPGTEWELSKKLGEGGFGEVWLARHRRTKEQRVFKFCFRADRLRSLKREMTLFRILKEILGERSDIARLVDVQFETAPFYLEIEYTAGGNLADWIQSSGGFENVAMDRRLEIVAKTAEALAAAHSVGVIHKDIKPSNILIEEKKEDAAQKSGRRSDSVQVRLTDFGIGQILDPSAFQRAGVTASGFTQTIGAITDRSSGAGTQIYMAPELIAGRPPSIQSDVYSLGVLLYQMIIGDFSQPMTTDWERRVEDPILCKDLRRCLAGDPAERFASAEELAQHIQALPERRVESVKREAAERAAARRRHAAKAFRGVAGLLALLALALGYGLYREKIQHNALLVEMEKTQQQLYYANIGLAEKSVQEIRYENANRLLAECPERYRHYEWGRLLYEANPEVMSLGGHDSGVRWAGFSTDGKRIATYDGSVVKVWDGQAGREILSRQSYSTFAVAFTSQGQCLALHRNNRQLVIRELEKDRQLGQAASLPFMSYNQAALSEDGRIAAIRGGGGRGTPAFVIFDARSGEVFPLPIAREQQDIRSFVLSSDGTRLAFALETSPTVMVLDIRSRKIIREFHGEFFAYRPVDISRDGSRLAIRRYNSVEVWDVNTGREIGDSTKRTEWHYELALSPDGKRFASYDQSRNAVVVWDVETGGEIKAIVGYSGVPHVTAFSPDGQFLVIAQGRTARVWDLESRGAAWKHDFPWLRSVGFSNKNEAVALTAKDQTVTLLSLDSRERIRAVNLRSPDLSENLGVTGGVVPDLSYESFVTFQPPNNYNVGTGSDGFHASAGGWLAPIVWDLETGQEIFKAGGLPCGASHVTLSEDGKRLATTSVDCTVHVFDVSDGNELCSFSLLVPIEAKRPFLLGIVQVKGSLTWQDTGPPSDLVFSPDGHRLAAANSDRVKVFDLDSGKRLFIVEGDYAAFSRDGKRLATVCSDATMKIWDAQTGQELQELREHNARCLAFSPDGERLVSGGDATVKVWDIAAERELVTLKGLEEQVISLAVSADGRRIAASDMMTAAVWDTFPWEEDAAPSLEERIRQGRINRWHADQKRLERARAYAAESSKAERKELEACAANLRTIYSALNRYRNEHDGQMPDWFSDLSPDYLTSATLRCPADPKGTASFYPDPKLPCSYSFEFTSAPMPPNYHANYGKTYREWKEKQLKEFGNVVPLARCMHHGDEVLSLSYSGNLFLSPLSWEDGPRQDYTTGTMDLRAE